MQFEISSALTALHTGMQLAVGAMELRDEAKAKEAIGNMAARLAEAQMAALRMAELLANLRSDLDEAKAQLAAAQKRVDEREKYVLRAVADGVFAYSFEPLGDDKTPPHYQCQICFDAGHSSVLAKDGRYLRCKRDGAHSLEVERMRPHVRHQRSSW